MSPPIRLPLLPDAIVAAILLTALALLAPAAAAAESVRQRSGRARGHPAAARPDRGDAQARGAVGPVPVRPRADAQSRRATTCAGKIADLEPRSRRSRRGSSSSGRRPARTRRPRARRSPRSARASTRNRARLDAPLKQARLLAARADQLAEQITERRRAAYARQLFEQSPSVLSPSLWLEHARMRSAASSADSERCCRLGRLLRAPEGRRAPACAVLTLLALGIAVLPAVALVAAARRHDAGRRPASARRWPRSACSCGSR